MDLNIFFEYEGKFYTAPPEAYKLNRIVLPDGRVLEAHGGWSKSNPPEPQDLREVKSIFNNSTLASIAENVKGVVAQRRA